MVKSMDQPAITSFKGLGPPIIIHILALARVPPAQLVGVLGECTVR